MVWSVQGWGVLYIFLTHTAVFVHAGYKYSFTVVEGHNVHLPVPKHCLDGHFLLDNENKVIAKFDRNLPRSYESGRGKLNDGCFSKTSARCDFRMKVKNLSESGTYRLYHTSLSKAPYPCDIVYSLEVWPEAKHFVTGKLGGFLNGIELEDLNIVVTCDKACNLSIDSLQRKVGLPITMLLSTDLFEIIGWMFAISDNEVPNGYTLTGGFCERIVKITYPNRRAVTMRQDFYKTIDKQNEFRLNTYINGTVPLKYLFTKNVRPFKARDNFAIPVQEYEEIYKQTSPGLIEMVSLRLQPFGNDTLNYTIHQMIRIKRPWVSTSDDIAHLKPAVLSVANILVSYRSDDMQARLKMTSNISLLEERILKDRKGHEIGLTDDMHRTVDLTPMEIVIPILLFLMILSLLLGYVRYCFRKKMQKESQVLIEEDATSLQNAYESIASDGSETIHRNEVNDTLDRDYLSPVFDAVNSNDEENQEGQTETRSHLQANTVVAYTSNVYEEIDSHSEIKYQQLSITNFKEVVVGNTSNSNQETGSNSQLTDHLQSNTDLQGLGNSPNTYEEIDSQTHRKQIACDTHILEASETESNSQLTDHLQHNTNLQQVLRNSQNTYEEIDGHTHRKQIMYDTDILEASATVQPSSNIDTISETKLKPGYEPIYYHLGHQQDVDSPVTDSHEYETVTPITHGTLNFVVNGLSEDGYMIPCVKNSDKVSTSKSEHIECTSEETLVKQISTSNTDLKTFYSTTYEDIERNRSAQQQLETGNIPNFEELGGSYPSLFNVESSDQDSSKSGDSNTGEL